MSIFNRISVMNGWVDAPHCWWRYLLLPFGWDSARRWLGWYSVSFFGFTFFWRCDLTEEEERVVRENGKKLMKWVEKNGRRSQ